MSGWILVLFLAVMFGSVIQGAIGFGLALISVPVLTLVEPVAVPVVVLLLALPMACVMAIRERSSMDLRGFYLLTAGRLAGTVAGVGLVVVIPNGSLTVVVGTLILAAVAMSLLRPQFEIHDGTRLAGGVASGVMSTAAAVGGPPIALIYQNRSGAELRSTLAISFVIGIFMSLVGLGVAGRISAEHVQLTLLLLPAMLLGLWLGTRLSRRTDGRWLRPAVLAFAGLSGAVVILTGLNG